MASHVTLATLRITARWVRIAFVCFVAIGGGACPVGLLAQEHETTTAHFAPPEGCTPDPGIAAAVRAVQACVERFSPTDELIMVLRVRRFRPNHPDVHASKESARQAVAQHVAALREANRSVPGRTLLSFEHMATLPKSYPPGADYCELVNDVQSDRRVPRHEGEEFRIWGESFICGRADLDTNTMEVLELRSSERFRLATDGKQIRDFVPIFAKATAAEHSLRY